MNKEYKSTSLHVSSYLIAKGFKLARTEKATCKTTFVFKFDPLLESATGSFFDNESIPVLDFINAQKNLKTRLYEGL